MNNIVRNIQVAETPGSRYKLLLYLILGATLFLSGLSLELLYFRDHYGKKDVRKFEQKLNRRERIVDQTFDEIIAKSAGRTIKETMDEMTPGLEKLSDNFGITFFYYERAKLAYWSDHTIIMNDLWHRIYDSPYLEMKNGSYVSVNRKTGSGRLLALICIRHHYPYENKFLENNFTKGYRFDLKVKIRSEQGKGLFPVVNKKGEYLFSFDFKDAKRDDRAKAFVSFLFYISSFLFFMLALNKVVSKYSGRKKWLWLLTAVVLVIISATVMIYFEIPHIIFRTSLFKPELYASRYFASLGHLLIYVLAVLIVTAFLHRHIKKEDIISAKAGYFLAALFLIFSAAWFLFLNHLFSTIVLDSNISFETYQITSVNIYSFAGLLIIGLSFISFIVLVDKAVSIAAPLLTKKLLRYSIIAIVLVLVPFVFIEFGHLDLAGWILFPLVIITMLRLRNDRGEMKFSRVLLILFLFSVYSAIQLQYYNRVDLDRKKEVELVKLSSEHDPIAEMLFSRLSDSIRNDNFLSGLILDQELDYNSLHDAVVDYLNRKYLFGYWDRYDKQFTLCTPYDTLYVEPPVDEKYHCFDFFGEMVRENGFNIPGTDFYYLNNMTGRVSYMGILSFSSESMDRNLFLEFDSKIINDELGYPELLLDKNFRSFTSTNFSYAKYSDGRLIAQSGFPYNLSPDRYSDGKPGFETRNVDGYDHKIYNVNKESIIIISSPEVNLVDDLVAFSYIFGYYSLLLIVFYLLAVFPGTKGMFSWSFKNRIQFSMAGILFLTFLFICSGTIFFIIKQYKGSHQESLRETMRSVYVELVNKLEFENDLGPLIASGYLDEQLRKFSNVFYSDINLYDSDGYLIATSRQDIFSLQLLSDKMDRKALINLGPGNASEFIHNEHIGGLKYLSAYVPLLNGDNKLLAYLNLPYFTRNDALAQDVTNLVVAIMNIYIILMLVILLVSVFLADRITQPLRMVQNKIAQVSLNMKNDKIAYKREDEIKGLVEEYNHMIDELSASAERLAQSERESAWREMAKQIAHEIKNPLTPMKLSIQHLQRTWNQEGINGQEAIDRISKTLIEQIDSLTSIANEFSDFAKMPRARSEIIVLPDVLKNVTDLFSSVQARVRLEMDEKRDLKILADHEQLTRVFINLVKNGIQAVPEGIQGEILIRLKVVPGSYAIVAITDNGKGIPEEIRDKLFKPNFTTKSSGMGMGLAITSNIIRTIGGEIWYETVLNKGTTFFVKLPLYKR